MPRKTRRIPKNDFSWIKRGLLVKFIYLDETKTATIIKKTKTCAKLYVYEKKNYTQYVPLDSIIGIAFNTGR